MLWEGAFDVALLLGAGPDMAGTRTACHELRRLDG